MKSFYTHIEITISNFNVSNNHLTVVIEQSLRFYTIFMFCNYYSSFLDQLRLNTHWRNEGSRRCKFNFVHYFNDFFNN